MAGINKVIIVGNLGSDPELKFLSNGSPVCQLSVATTRSWKNKQTNEKMSETEWHRVQVWGPTAEHCSNYLSKGRQVYIEGRIKTRSYDDKDGVKRYTTEIVAETVQFLGGKEGGDDRQSEGGGNGGGGGGGGGGARGGGGGGGGARGGGGTRGAEPSYNPGDYSGPPDDDDIPF